MTMSSMSRVFPLLVAPCLGVVLMAGCKATSTTPASGPSSSAVTGTAAGAPTSVASAAPSVAPSGGLSINEKLATIQVCVSAGGNLRTVAIIGAKVAQQSLTPAAATQQLQPINDKIGTLAKENAALPIGHSLTQLSDAITAIEKLSPTDLSGIQTGSGTLLTATKAVIASCADIRH